MTSVVETKKDTNLSDGDNLTTISKISQDLKITTDKDVRKKLLGKLSDVLTVHEAASLIVRIHDKNAKKENIKDSYRFGLYPIQDWKSFARAKQMEATLWPSDEIEFHTDLNDFMNFTDKEKKPLLRAFGFFAVADGSIVGMLAYQMILLSNVVEKQQFYVLQLVNEMTHAETYGKMIHTLVTDKNERDEIFDSVSNVKSIKAMNDFIVDSFTYPEGKRQLLVSLVATEFLMFTPLFCIIFWYRVYKRGKIKRTIFSNEQIAKDECNHGNNGAANYLELPDSEKYTDQEIWKFIDKVVRLVSDFADDALYDVSLTELTPKNVKQYIRFVADDVLDRLGHKKYYKVSNPFKWMDFTNLVPKTNFYSGSVGEYSRFNVNNSIENAKKLCDGIVDIKKKNVYKRVNKAKF